MATSVNRVYRIPDRPINWLTEPGTRLALCNRGAPSFSFQGVRERQEGERASNHNSFAHTRVPPSTTCGYERVTLRILLSGCSRSLRRLLTFSHTSPQLIVLPITRAPLYCVADKFSFFDEKKKLEKSVSAFRPFQVTNSFRGDVAEIVVGELRRRF